FDIQPDFHLAVMRPNQSLAQLTAMLFAQLDVVLNETCPDWVLAQGDTTTVLVTGLIANYHRVRFGHVEAGLRTGDKARPFPEELNRRVADAAADAIFAPTIGASENLHREGHSRERIHVTGNTVVDAVLQVARSPYDWDRSRWSALVRSGRLVLVTAHRRESFGEPLHEMCRAARE